MLSSVVTALMRLDSEADDYFDQLVEVIESDPSFTTRILASANSVLLAGQEPVTSLQAAIARMGSAAATDVVVSLSVLRVFVPRSAGDRALWRHGLQVATAARALAKCSASVGVDPNNAYTAGLLHDVGRFVLMQEAPAKLSRIDESEWEDPEGLLAAERSIVGMNHAELGTLACSKWGLPSLIAEVVRDHHKDPAQVEVSKLTALVHLADLGMFDSVLHEASAPGESLNLRQRELLVSAVPRWLTLGVSELFELLTTAAHEANARADALGV